MYIKSIRVKNFRNHSNTELEFGQKANIILGDNGEGKTNLLEAISYISLTKSFYASSDSVVITLGEDIFEIESDIASNNDKSSKIHIAYSVAESEKVYSINKRRIEPFSSVIGKFPIVILSPENSNITFGGPSDRRKFLDLVISQSSALYLEDLSEFRKILRHRNKILIENKYSKADISFIIEPWNKQLVSTGSKIILKRKDFINNFYKYISEAYTKIVDIEEVPHIEYSPSFEITVKDNLDTIKEKFFLNLEQKRTEEIRIGSTLVGPHRDELILKINGLDLRKFASQGQHKTFLIALKIGEFFFLKEVCNETPVFLLDDVFSELDEARAQRMLKLIETLSQTFITSTNSGVFDKALEFGEKNKKFFVKSGKIEIN